MNLPRSSGILLHPTSLPGGRLGPEAYRFVDWLEEAGQSWWQVLPVGPPDDTGSPYFALSAFAGWRGLLAKPAAPVSAKELEAFVAAYPFIQRAERGKLAERALGVAGSQPAGEQLVDLLLNLRRWRYGASHGVGPPFVLLD